MNELCCFPTHKMVFKQCMPQASCYLIYNSLWDSGLIMKHAVSWTSLDKRSLWTFESVIMSRIFDWPVVLSQPKRLDFGPTGGSIDKGPRPFQLSGDPHQYLTSCHSEDHQPGDWCRRHWAVWSLLSRLTSIIIVVIITISASLLSNPNPPPTPSSLIKSVLLALNISSLEPVAGFGCRRQNLSHDTTCHVMIMVNSLSRSLSLV